MDYLQALNEKQRQAVTAALEPILVLAGPGTGKTRTLIARILYFIRQCNIAPHKIIAVTFTNKAKEEMRARLNAELGDIANDVLIGTFHHYCLDALRAHHAQAGLPKQFTVADETAQLIALSRASRVTDERSLKTVMNAISSYRLNKDNLNPTFQGAAEKWLPAYHDELRKNNLIDFDQILLLTRDLFQAHPELVEAERQRFDAILIDEFQDTDPVQYNIIRALAQRHRNLFAVADDDQSIFAWRGAHTGNIARFLDDFACRDRLVVLNENYRSAQCIIDRSAQLLAGHRLIEKRLQAALTPRDGFAPEIAFRQFADDTEETAFILAQIAALKGECPALNYADFAILYPIHAIGEQLETKLLSAKIPCQLVKRQGIFDQDDVKKLILLLTLIQNPDDDVALEQYVALELNNPAIMQRVNEMKRPGRAFKQTLSAAMWREDVPGMSKGQFSRVVSTCFGTISNLISHVEQNPGASLDTLVNDICNLTQLTHSASLHGRAQSLRDPLDIQGIPAAAACLRDAAARGASLRIIGSSAELTRLCEHLLKTLTGFESLSGLENAVIICLDAEAWRTLAPTDAPRIVMADVASSPSVMPIVSPFAPVVTLFKLMQAVSAAKMTKPFRSYVAFDLETTSGDTRAAGIVEIGAVKVRDGEIVGKFGRLVNPEQPITEGAFKVHGISESEVKDAPTLKELLPELLDFIGNDMLVAHNGFDFDFPILLRLHRQCAGEILPNRRFDTLPLARRLFPGQPASVDALMTRFGIQDIGGRHRALDDAVYLTPIFERLQEIEQSLNRRTEFEELLEIVALGLAVAAPSALSDEERLLFRLGASKLLSRFSELPDALRPLFLRYQLDIEAQFEAICAADAETHEQAQAAQVFSGKSVAIARLKELARAFPSGDAREAMRRFLDHAMLYASQDDIRSVNAVNLFTIHSAKGLEFPVVFVCGVEKGNLPSFYSVREEGELREKKLDEQRRLLYVAMTRAKQKLFITYVDKRGDFPKKRSQFLIELGVETREDVETTTT